MQLSKQAINIMKYHLEEITGRLFYMHRHIDIELGTAGNLFFFSKQMSSF